MTEVYCKDYPVRPEDSDSQGRLLPSMMLRLSQYISGEHCSLLGADGAVLEEKELFWAIIRNRLEISRLPRQGQVLTLKTWPLPTTRTAYPRVVVAYDEGGQEAFRVSALWVLMHRTSRALVLPAAGVNVEGIAGPVPANLPRSLSPVEAQVVRSRTVAAEDLDQNRHMNNARYLDWVFDALPDSCDAGQLRQVQLCYMNEAREGETLTVGVFADGCAPQVDIARPDGTRIFSAKLDFDGVVP